MNSIALRARREALGLSQGSLASLLGVSQAAIARWESGGRAIPSTLDEEIAVQEEIVEQLVDHAVQVIDYAEGEPTALIVYLRDSELWEAHPEMMGVPAVLHRVAMARARAMADGPCDLVDGGR